MINKGNIIKVQKLQLFYQLLIVSSKLARGRRYH
jgi:hypothetical protein